MITSFSYFLNIIFGTYCLFRRLFVTYLFFKFSEFCLFAFLFSILDDQTSFHWHSGY